MEYIDIIEEKPVPVDCGCGRPGWLRWWFGGGGRPGPMVVCWAGRPALLKTRHISPKSPRILTTFFIPVKGMA